jgi:hypothetical protein
MCISKTTVPDIKLSHQELRPSSTLNHLQPLSSLEISPQLYLCGVGQPSLKQFIARLAPPVLTAVY